MMAFWCFGLLLIRRILRIMSSVFVLFILKEFSPLSLYPSVCLSVCLNLRTFFLQIDCIKRKYYTVLVKVSVKAGYKE